MKQIRLIVAVLFLGSVFSLLLVGQSHACIVNQQACSSSYGVSRYSFDNGGTLDTTCSTDYCAAQTVGEDAIGNTSSSSYQVQAGFNVNREPSLEFLVNTSNINAGVLSASSTATATATFSVESYLSSGYSVVTVGSPPQSGSYALSAPSTPTTSQIGTEQFGINLVGNYQSGGTVSSSCGTVNFGANPVQVPSSSFSYGSAAYNSGSDYYNTCGYFMYKNGDVIANSTKSSGQTNYTISYIFNITNITPDGSYTMEQQLVAVPTF